MIDIIANFCKKKSIFVIFFIVLITVNPSEEKKKTLFKTEFVHAMIVKDAFNQRAHETADRTIWHPFMTCHITALYFV